MLLHTSTHIRKCNWLPLIFWWGLYFPYTRWKLLGNISKLLNHVTRIFSCTSRNVFGTCVSIIVHYRIHIMEAVFSSWCFYSTFISAIFQHSHKKWMEIRLVFRIIVSFPHLLKPHSLTYLEIDYITKSSSADEWFMYWLIEFCRRKNEMTSLIVKCMKIMKCGLQASGIYFDRVIAIINFG